MLLGCKNNKQDVYIVSYIYIYMCIYIYIYIVLQTLLFISLTPDIDLLFECTSGVDSSIGMVKAALEAVNGTNIFGLHGANWSTLFIDIDAHFRNRINFNSFIPRESHSKVNCSKRCQLCFFGVH